MRPYLKGLHLSIDGWRQGRDSEGWKLPAKIWQRFDRSGMTDLASASGDGQTPPPKEVEAAPRLAGDLRALRTLFNDDAPAVRCVRPAVRVSIQYGFLDASGAGYGDSFQEIGPTKAADSGINYRVGVWGSDMDESSSNYRELRNLTEAVEKEARFGRMKDAEVFIFTDNTTAEACFAKGTSSSPILFDLVLRLPRLEMEAGLVLHVIHCAGTRMIEQGTDGLSRGDLLEGVMKGDDFLSHVPLELSPEERSPSFRQMMKELFGSSLVFLEPKDWFIRGHGIVGWNKHVDGLWFPRLAEKETYVWQPPPAAAQAAVEELRKSRLKRQLSNSGPIFLVVICTYMDCHPPPSTLQ